jgi:hypothetical protein
MNYYIVHHHSRFGEDVFLAYSNHKPSRDEVVEAFGLDFENNRDDEWIEISKVYPQTLRG